MKPVFELEFYENEVLKEEKGIRPHCEALFSKYSDQITHQHMISIIESLINFLRANKQESEAPPSERFCVINHSQIFRKENNLLNFILNNLEQQNLKLPIHESSIKDFNKKLILGFLFKQYFFHVRQDQMKKINPTFRLEKIQEPVFNEMSFLKPDVQIRFIFHLQRNSALLMQKNITCKQVFDQILNEFSERFNQLKLNPNTTSFKKLNITETQKAFYRKLEDVTVASHEQEQKPDNINKLIGKFFAFESVVYAATPFPLKRSSNEEDHIEPSSHFNKKRKF